MNPKNSINSVNSKNSLITGGCGFIGVNLVDFLLEKGIRKFRILDNLSIGKLEYLEAVLNLHGEVTKNIADNNKIIYTVPLHLTDQRNQTDQRKQENQIDKIRIELIIGDIRDKETCLETTKGIDYVIHLAAHAGIIPSIQNPFYDFEVNVLGTLNLLNVSVTNKVERFIFASSNAPLGDQNPPLNENKVPRPLSPYGASKLACEAYCLAFYHSYGLKTVVLRFSNAYGSYSIHKNSVIAKFIKDGLIKGLLTIYGEGNQTRDFIHVIDICNGIFLCLTFNDNQSTKINQVDQTNQINPKDPMNSINPIWGEVFHLGTGKETSITNLAQYIGELFENNIKINFESERKGEINRNYSDINKAKGVFGFEPNIHLNEGVREVFEWFMKQGKESIKNTLVLSGSD